MIRTDCPKCGGRMEMGFVMDNTYGGRVRSDWIEGIPDYSKWSGLRIKGRRKIPTTTHRCARCGYLESYAPDQV